MNRTAHKHFATASLGVITPEAYDEINAAWEAKNAAIRAARVALNDAYESGNVAKVIAAEIAFDLVAA